ncbi:MAG: hypothetical protein SOH65_08920 [Bifidobacterium sp.]
MMKLFKLLRNSMDSNAFGRGEFMIFEGREIPRMIRMILGISHRPEYSGNPVIRH